MKILKFYGVHVFCFLGRGFLNFLKVMKMRPNMTNTTVKFTGKVGLKFCKLNFFNVNEPSYFQVFFKKSKVKKFEKVLNSGMVCFTLVLWLSLGLCAKVWHFFDESNYW